MGTPLHPALASMERPFQQQGAPFAHGDGQVTAAFISSLMANAHQQSLIRAAAGLPPQGVAVSPFEHFVPQLRPPPGLTLAEAQQVLEQHSQQLQQQRAQQNLQQAEQFEQNQRETQKLIRARGNAHAPGFHVTTSPSQDEDSNASSGDDRRSSNENAKETKKQRGRSTSAEYSSSVSNSPASYAKRTVTSARSQKRQSALPIQQPPSKRSKASEVINHRFIKANETVNTQGRGETGVLPDLSNGTRLNPEGGAKCPLIGPFLESFEQGTFLENLDKQVSRVLSGFNLYGKRLEMQPQMPFPGFPGQQPLPPLIVGYSEQQLHEMAETMVKQQNRALSDAVRMTYLECKSRHEGVMEEEFQKKLNAAINRARSKFDTTQLSVEAKSNATMTKLVEDKLQRAEEEKDKLKSELEASKLREAELVEILGRVGTEKKQLQRERVSLKLEMDEMKRNHARSLRAYMKASVTSLRTLRRRQED